MRKITLCILVLWPMPWLLCQVLTVNYHPPVPDELDQLTTGYEGPYADTTELVFKINSLKALLYGQGYLFSESHIGRQGDTVTLQIETGPQILQAQPTLKLPEGYALPQMPERKKIAEAATAQNLENTIEYYLQFYENHGHPFASLSFENYNIKNDTLQGTIALHPGPEIRLDSVVIKGFDRFSKNVLRYDLGYRPGMLYSEKYLNQLPQKTQQVEYLNMVRPPAVAFTRQRSVLFLYLEEVKSNQVDGVIGLNTDENGEVSLNGELQLRLLHIFKKGEEINLKWRRPDESVQTLNFDLQLPYLINTPFWLETNLGIFRQDSSFINTNLQGLLKYLIESGSFISGGVTYRASNVLQAVSSGQLSDEFGSFNTVYYKLGVEFNKTNRALIPTHGYRLKAYGLRGNRNTSDARTLQYGWQIDYQLWTPLFNNRHILRTRLNSEALFGSSLFVNELYRIGGLKTLRGFNEQSIYTSSYGIGTLEYRYMIGQYDYLTLFSDVGYVENKSAGSFSSNLFTGVGAGISFQTGGGIFSLFYAIGKDDANPFDLRTSKIHFGYINRF